MEVIHLSTAVKPLPRLSRLIRLKASSGAYSSDDILAVSFVTGFALLIGLVIAPRRSDKPGVEST